MNVNHEVRNKTILRYNLAGIVMNLALAVAKLIIGLIIHSRSVILDAVNGFTDMVSSLLSLISVFFSSRPSDQTHPFGYGRVEYVTSMFIAVFVMLTGLHSIYSSVLDLMNPDAGAPQYNFAVIILMVISLAAKIIYGLRTRAAGQKISSSALILSGADSLGDAAISVAILATILIYRVKAVNLESWLSILIALLLIRTGFEMLRDCLNKLLGVKGDPAYYDSIKKLIADEPEVRNAFNLVIHNYGEALAIGSIDIVVDDTMSASDSTKLMRRIIRKAAEKGVRMSSVGIYGSAIHDPEIAAMWDSVLTIVISHPEFLRAYAFSYDAVARVASFDVVSDPSLGYKKREEAFSSLQADLEEAFPGVAFMLETALDL